MLFNENDLYQIRDVLNDRIKFLNSCNPKSEELLNKNLEERRKLLVIVSKIEKNLIGGENA